MRWLNKHITKRKLIDKKEEKISFVQLMGFILIVSGIIYLLLKIIHPFSIIHPEIDGDRLAIVFFIIMLGISFAYPSLLEGNEGLSTMRIVVFMMVNVICMLLLKIGWDNKITSLSQIGLDYNWMGVIAFLFGAKATQSYFDNKVAIANNLKPTDNNNDATIPSDEQLIDKTIEKYKQKLLSIINVVGVYKTYENIDSKTQATLLIKVKKKTTIEELLPEGLKLESYPDKNIPYLVVTVGDSIKAFAGANAAAKITTSDSNTISGTLGCILQLKNTEPNNKYGLTCFHVIKKPMDNGWDYIKGDENIAVSIDGENIGTVMCGKCYNDLDYAIIELKDNTSNNNAINNPNQTARLLGDDDFRMNRAVSFKGSVSTNSGFAKGIDPDPLVVSYSSGVTKYFRNLYFFSNSATESKPMAQEGDSGSLIVDEANTPIAILIGSNEAFTYGLPIKPIIDDYDMQLV